MYRCFAATTRGCDVSYARFLLGCALAVVALAAVGATPAAGAPRLVVAQGHEEVPTGTEVTAPITLAVYEAGEGTELFQCPLELDEGVLERNDRVVDAAVFGGTRKAAGFCLINESRPFEFKWMSAPAKVTVSVGATVAVTFPTGFEVEILEPDHVLPCIYKLKKLEGNSAAGKVLSFGASGVLARERGRSGASCVSVLTAVISAGGLSDSMGELQAEVQAG